MHYHQEGCIIDLLVGNIVFIIAHRGASGTEPENTLPAFTLALEQKSDMIETDVHVCASGEAVLCHNPGIPVGGEIRNISGLTLSELQAFDAGEGNRIPTLNEMLNHLNPEIKINLELKGPGSETKVAEILKERIKTGNWSADNFLITSFDHFRVEEFRVLMPEVPRGALFKSQVLYINEYLEKLSIKTLITNFEFINKSRVDEVHHTGRKVMVYTVNNKSDILRMADMRVDGIITNYPKKARQLLGTA